MLVNAYYNTAYLWNDLGQGKTRDSRPYGLIPGFPGLPADRITAHYMSMTHSITGNRQ
jgi:hypothetical protein